MRRGEGGGGEMNTGKKIEYCVKATAVGEGGVDVERIILLGRRMGKSRMGKKSP